MDLSHSVNVPGWVFVSVLCFVSGFALAWLLARWYQRQRTAGFSKDQIIEHGKQIAGDSVAEAIAKAQRNYDTAIAMAKREADKLNTLRGG
jgi:hypothetical protein